MQRRLLAKEWEREGSVLSLSVESELEAKIARGELGPGQHVNKLALARRLGVSRGPVGEAVRALDRTGFVTTIARFSWENPYDKGEEDGADRHPKLWPRQAPAHCLPGFRGPPGPITHTASFGAFQNCSV